MAMTCATFGTRFPQQPPVPPPLTVLHGGKVSYPKVPPSVPGKFHFLSAGQMQQQRMQSESSQPIAMPGSSVTASEYLGRRSEQDPWYYDVRMDRDTVVTAAPQPPPPPPALAVGVAFIELVAPVPPT